MGKLFTESVLNAVVLWLTTLLIGGITVTPFPGAAPYNSVLSFLVLGLFLGMINTLLLPVVKFITLPLYILTLGLWSFVVNGFALWLLKLLSDGFGWGVQIPNFWWDAVWAAIIFAILNWVVTAIAHAVGVSRE